MGERFTCRRAFVGLSGIAETFIPDLRLLSEDSDPISRGVVTLSTTGSRDRATSWLTFGGDVAPVSTATKYSMEIHSQRKATSLASSPTCRFPSLRHNSRHLPASLDKYARAGAILDLGVHAFTWVELAFCIFRNTCRLRGSDSM